MGDAPYLAWCFDEAVSLFGGWVEARLEEREPIRRGGKVVGTRPRWRLGELLGEKPRVASAGALRAVFGGEMEIE